MGTLGKLCRPLAPGGSSNQAREKKCANEANVTLAKPGKKGLS
jgi:hypothetical protein